MTTRDDTWDVIIRTLVEEGEFKISDLPLEDSQRQTVRRVCREMESLGWLDRSSKQSKTWKAGELADMHLNLHMRAKVAAGYDDDE